MYRSSPRRFVTQSFVLLLRNKFESICFVLNFFHESSSYGPPNLFTMVNLCVFNFKSMKDSIPGIQLGVGKHTMQQLLNKLNKLRTEEISSKASAPANVCVHLSLKEALHITCPHLEKNPRVV